MVKVMDTDRNPLVVVEFTSFEVNASFDDNSFDVEKNMSSAQIEVPTMATGDREPFAVKYPLEQPAGVDLVEEKEVDTENGKRVILTFGGEEVLYFNPRKRRDSSTCFCIDINIYEWSAC